MYIPNLIIVAGTGTKSGKTSFICRVIDQFKESGVCAIKITPHFHEVTPGLSVKSEGKGFTIYEESNRMLTKDTSRMLNAGAKKVYFAKVWDEELAGAFNKTIEMTPPGSPIICESPALRKYVEPGLFVIMSADSNNKQKDINELEQLPHMSFKLEELANMEILPIVFREGRWHENKLI